MSSPLRIQSGETLKPRQKAAMKYADGRPRVRYRRTDSAWTPVKVEIREKEWCPAVC